jgi:hypothetical protein
MPPLRPLAPRSPTSALPTTSSSAGCLRGSRNDGPSESSTSPGMSWRAPSCRGLAASPSSASSTCPATASPTGSPPAHRLLGPCRAHAHQLHFTASPEEQSEFNAFLGQLPQDVLAISVLQVLYAPRVNLDGRLPMHRNGTCSLPVLNHRLWMCWEVGQIHFEDAIEDTVLTLLVFSGYFFL